MKGKLIKTDVNYILEDDNGVVIASTSLKKGGLSLSLKNCQAIEHGYDLDEKISNHLEDNHIEASTRRVDVIKTLILELLGDKKFNEEDVRKAIEIARKGSMQEQHNGYGMSTGSIFVLDNLSFDEFIQSQQQTEWDVEFEMEYVGECNGNNDNGCFQDSPGHNCGCFERKPKLDDEGCLILKKYKNG